MDFEATAAQQEVLNAVEAMIHREAGAARIREIGVDGHDDRLLALLDGNGYLDVASSPDHGPVCAALIAESAARSLAGANVALRMLVGRALPGEAIPARIAVTSTALTSSVRWAVGAEAVLVVDGDDVLVSERPAVQPVKSVYGYPFGALDPTSLASARRVAGAGRSLQSWWQVALAVEAAGLLAGAHKLTVEYLSNRNQFGKPLGSLQALQHRLAEAHVWIAGTQWLARKAAWSGARPEEAAAAATYAVRTIKAVANDLHQLTGAIGFTMEYDLQLYTMRLWALRVEFGGLDAHARALSAARWG